MILAPGEAPPVHTHPDAEQVFFVIEGEGDLGVGADAAERHPLRVGDFVRTPPGVPHSVRCVGDSRFVYLEHRLLHGRPAGGGADLGQPRPGDVRHQRLGVRRGQTGSRRGRGAGAALAVNGPARAPSGGAMIGSSPTQGPAGTLCRLPAGVRDQPPQRHPRPDPPRRHRPGAHAPGQGPGLLRRHRDRLGRPGRCSHRGLGGEQRPDPPRDRARDTNTGASRWTTCSSWCSSRSAGEAFVAAVCGRSCSPSCGDGGRRGRLRGRAPAAARGQPARG